ncbi:MAG: hypothetical protein KFF73_11530 [Cyclobacteriaceae bacterium]|nr:hypothetical protein [Cyclobacteriaceae bacterium]
MIGTASIIAMFMLIVSLIVGFAGLIKEKDLPDKVVAQNLIGVIILGIILTYIFFTKKTIYLDVAVATILIVFTGTVMIARYLIRMTDDD